LEAKVEDVLEVVKREPSANARLLLASVAVPETASLTL
jgi:hypothetical protein